MNQKIIQLLEQFKDMIHEEADINNHASDTTDIDEAIEYLKQQELKT